MARGNLGKDKMAAPLKTAPIRMRSLPDVTELVRPPVAVVGIKIPARGKDNTGKRKKTNG